jgi:hypothetical protein
MLVDVEDLHREDTGKIERSGVMGSASEIISRSPRRFFRQVNAGIALGRRRAGAAQLTNNSLGRCGVNRGLLRDDRPRPL